MMTAEEYIKNHYENDVKNHFLNFNKDGEQTYEEYAESNPLKTLEEGFIEFTRLHVQEALKAANKFKAMNINNGNVGYLELEYPGKNGKDTITINENSILKAYPLSLIK